MLSLNGFNQPVGIPPHVGRAVCEMRTGSIRLSVPLLDDIIQIGGAGKLTTGTIEVAKTPSIIAVRRTDGKPLQAEILHKGEGEPAMRRTVFHTPVDSLELLRVPIFHGSGLWIITRGGRIRRRPELIQLVQTIIAFASAKQRQAAAAAVVATSSASTGHRNRRVHSSSHERRCATANY